MSERPIVIVESPYKPRPNCENCGIERERHPLICKSCKNHLLSRNKDYLQAAMLDCMDRGETPVASHKLYTDVLDDEDDGDRSLGIEMGYDLMELSSYVAMYTDLGVQGGMIDAKKIAQDKLGLEIKYRTLEDWE